MNECYYCFLLLGLFSNFQCSSPIKDSLVNLPNITIQHFCENDILFLKCLNDNETIQIVRSMYGRTSQRICNNDLNYRFFDKTCANIQQSKIQTKLRCHGKSTCQMLVDNQIFNDPCGSSVPKHFEVHYRCINKNDVCMKLFLNCSKNHDIKCIENIQQEFSCECPSDICQYENNQIIGFIENFCPQQFLQGFYWNKTSVNHGQYLSCPSPCTGQIHRFCHLNGQWSNVNYTNCKCPIKQSDQLSTHRIADRYIFQCNFWLIDRILPKDNSCIASFINWKDENDSDNSLNCLINAYRQMKSTSCSFGIDFQNIAFHVNVPTENESSFNLNDRIILDQIRLNKENLPLMIIHRKTLDSMNESIILIGHNNMTNSIDKENVTITFQYQPSKYDFQCRAYHSIDFSSSADSSNSFFACQLICSNQSHVICQCPFHNPIMNYVLHFDKTKPNNRSKFNSDFNDECSKEKHGSFDENLNKIDRYLKVGSIRNYSKDILLYLDQTIENNSFITNLKLFYQMMKQIEYVSVQLFDNISNSFVSNHKHIEIFFQTKRNYFENDDRTVSVKVINKKPTLLNIQLIVSIISNVKLNQSLNSKIINLNIIEQSLSIDFIDITFSHLNQTNQNPTCVYLNTSDNENIHWSSNGCRLLSTNSTHSICSCEHHNVYALFLDYEKNIKISSTNRLLSISKIGCIVSIIWLLLTLFVLVFTRHHMNMNDDLTIVRNILHTNMLLCLIIVQILFLFGINQIKYKLTCRIISILIDYFLLSTFSWMFVDGIELLIALKHVFKMDRIRLLAYSLYSYGFPLVIVSLSISFSIKNVVNSNKYCWLLHDNAFLWAYAIHFIFLIIANACFLIVSIYSICKNFNPSDYINQIRFSLRDISIISILFGFTWLFALFYLYDQTNLFAYLFSIFNSFHGFLVFLSYCVFQSYVKNCLKKILIYQKYSPPLFQRFIRPNQTADNCQHKKSIEHCSLPDNTSTSGYSSVHSTEVQNKQILSNQIVDLNSLSKRLSFHEHYDRRIRSTNETPYLPSMPVNLLSNRLSTFRCSLPPNEMIISREQHEQLLERNSIPDDDHQYYEIG